MTRAPAQIRTFPTAVRLSVVICTHNRARYLEAAIRSVLAQDYPQPAYELIVVDNRSTDDTAAVCRAFEPQANFRYVFEPELGLCHARNRGWRAAAGEFVVYLDDDAVAEPGWLQATEAAFASPTGEVGVVGGRVEPIWQAPRPPWVSDSVATSLTIIDWGPARKEIADVRREWLAGVNMAVPRRVLAEVGGFDPRLDRSGTHMLSGGDVFLQEVIVKRGYACVYEPGMRVRHLVSKERAQKRWFRRRYYWQGVSDAVMQLIRQRPGRARRLGEALRRLGALLRRPRAVRALLQDGEDPAAFERGCFAWIEVGHIAGLLGVARA
jgi:glycosyltransferase involved in cell wall biosynthesis